MVEIYRGSLLPTWCSISDSINRSSKDETKSVHAQLCSKRRKVTVTTDEKLGFPTNQSKTCGHKVVRFGSEN